MIPYAALTLSQQSEWDTYVRLAGLQVHDRSWLWDTISDETFSTFRVNLPDSISDMAAIRIKIATSNPVELKWKQVARKGNRKFFTEAPCDTS